MTSKKKAKVSVLSDVSWSNLYEDKLQLIAGDENKVVDLLVDLFVELSPTKLEATIVRNLVHEVKSYYYDNPYHNFEHAASVLLNCAYCLLQIKSNDDANNHNHSHSHSEKQSEGRSTRAGGKRKTNENGAAKAVSSVNSLEGDSNPSEFQEIERIALLFSALIHDLGHLGVPNSILIQHSHESAIRYNDQSVAEMHSISIGLDLIAMEKFNLLKHFSVEDKRKFRDIVIDVVLATDIAVLHKQMITFLRVDMLTKTNSVSNSATTNSTKHNLVHQTSNNIKKDTKGIDDSHNNGMDISTLNGKIVLLSLILRLADIGAITQSFATMIEASRRLHHETKLVNLSKLGPSVTADSFFTNQIVFMETYVTKLVLKVQSTNQLKKCFIDNTLSKITENLVEWKEKGVQLSKEWDTVQFKNKPIYLIYGKQ